MQSEPGTIVTVTSGRGYSKKKHPVHQTIEMKEPQGPNWNPMLEEEKG